MPAKSRSILSRLWGWPVRWDSDKARRNLAKHGLSFGDAESVLRDPLAIMAPDVVHSLHEPRFRVTGCDARGGLLVVIIAIDTSATIIRLISARRPTRRERHAYEGKP